MTPYRALLFDLFNTVALWQPARMPRFTWRGKTTPSTLGELRGVLREHAPTVGFEAFHTAFHRVNQTLAAERARAMREIPSGERFRRTLLQTGMDAGAATDELALRLSRRHMEILADVSTIPAEHVAFLERLRQRYPLALVSNFDHAPTARAIIERDNAASCFAQVVISDEHGHRKPHRQIFTDSLAALGVAPQEALFVGDSVEDDLVGAGAAGIDVAWVNVKSAPLPAGVAPPAYTVRRITELESVLL